MRGGDDCMALHDACVVGVGTVCMPLPIACIGLLVSCATNCLLSVLVGCVEHDQIC
jgi:hypothetical protein